MAAIVRTRTPLVFWRLARQYRHEYLHNDRSDVFSQSFVFLPRAHGAPDSAMLRRNEAARDEMAQRDTHRPSDDGYDVASLTLANQ